MEWEVRFTDEFGEWWDGLTADEQESVNASVIRLQKLGPSLGFPHTSGVARSRYPYMRELRIQHAGRPYRVLYAFDPERSAILLTGGDRGGTTGGTTSTYCELTSFMPNIFGNAPEHRRREMTRNFRELQRKMTPGPRARSERRAAAMLKDMALDELRAARAMTQAELGHKLGLKQAAISRMERRTDVYVSTLAKFVEAMGGQLEIRVVFPDGTVRINQFSDARDAAQKGKRRATVAAGNAKR
jgi:DNA-binding Xre family transcriptional regulator